MWNRVTIFGAVTAIAVAICWFIWDSKRIDSLREAETGDRFRALIHEINRAALEDGIKFSRIIGTGVVVDPIVLPEEIWAHPREEATNYVFRDAWGQPLHVRLALTGSNGYSPKKFAH